jgi:hypothetical protein
MSEEIVIQQPRETIEFKEQGVVIVQVPFTFVPFHFMATEGQTEFILSSSPRPHGVLSCMINGIGQSEARGDFSVVGAILIFNEELQESDEVAGVYAQAI